MVGMVVWAGCLLRAPDTPPGSALEVMYRQRREGDRAASLSSPAVTTSAYRDVLAKSIFSRCRMVPSDSEMFDVLMKRCGVVRAVLRSSARLLLERAATPAYLRPVRLHGRLQWLDPPGRQPCD
jgi:putative component of membrane protein insertase Oxa1/YidC/SpoIIIJ protein YidD